jgi:hypothetical protein
MDPFLILLIIQAFIFGAFSAFIAGEKNRDSAGWFWAGFFFSFVALLALIAVPKLDKAIQKDNPQILNVPPGPPVPVLTKIFNRYITIISWLSLGDLNYSRAFAKNRRLLFILFAIIFMFLLVLSFRK